MTTTAAHNSARQYMHHADEDRMQLWRGEQLPNPRQATNGQHSCPQSPQEISKYEGNTYCLPQPSIMTADSTHDGSTPKSFSGLVSRTCVCRMGLWIVGWRMFWCWAWQRLPGVPASPGRNSIKMHIIQPESQSGQIPADFPRCGWVRSVGDTVPPPV